MRVSRGPAKVSESIARWKQVYLILKTIWHLQPIKNKRQQLKIALRGKATMTACDEHKNWSMGIYYCVYFQSMLDCKWVMAICRNYQKWLRDGLCASEVDRKPIHPDVYHERRWLLWYLILSQTITMQSVTKPCRPPPAAGPDNLRIPKVLGYGFGETRAKAKPHYKTW